MEQSVLLQMGLNQSIAQLITSVTTLIGVFVMMLSINVWMTLAALLILPMSMLSALICSFLAWPKAAAERKPNGKAVLTHD